MQFLPLHIPALVRVWIVRVQLPHPFLFLVLIHLEDCLNERLHILDFDVLIHVSYLHDLMQIRSLVLSFISIVVSLRGLSFLCGHLFHHLLESGSTEQFMSSPISCPSSVLPSACMTFCATPFCRTSPPRHGTFPFCSFHSRFSRRFLDKLGQVVRDLLNWPA